MTGSRVRKVGSNKAYIKTSQRSNLLHHLTLTAKELKMELNIKHYSCFLIRFGNEGEVAQNSRGQLQNLFDHLFGHEDEDGLERLQITPCHSDGNPCQVNQDGSLDWFNSDLELIK